MYSIVKRLRVLLRLDNPRLGDLTERTSRLEQEWQAAKVYTDAALARERKLTLELTAKRMRARRGP